MNINMQMYDDTMTAIHNYLIQQSFTTQMTYTSELVPERNQKGEMYGSQNNDRVSGHEVLTDG